MTLIPRQQTTGQTVVPFKASCPRGGREAYPAAADPATSPDDGAEQAASHIAQLEKTLLLEREEHKQACQAARAEGREEGLRQAATRDHERFDLLREALKRASAECSAKIEQRADLAVTIARAALQRVFGARWQHAGMVEAIIRHDALQLAADSIIRVRVSADDFPDDDTLRGLAAARSVAIERDAQLESGACQFDCTLGTIDASIPIQAEAVDALLARIAAGTGGTA